MNDYPSVPIEQYGLDSDIIEWCFEEAETGLKKGEVPVGCLFIRKKQDGTPDVIARAHNRTNEFKSALKHAEIDCINQIVDRYKNSYAEIFKETIVVLTLEPCIMCCRILRKLKFKAVLFGARNERFGGAGSVYNVDTDPRISDDRLLCISSALDPLRAISLLQCFYDQTNENAPQNKVIMS